MKKGFILIALFLLCFLPVLGVAQVNLDIHIGNAPAAPPPPLPPPPPPAVGPPPVVLQEPPHMVFDEGLGIYIAVGVPYDIFFYNNLYYYHVNGVWYRAPYYNGPWTHAEFRRIPRIFRQYRIEELRNHREHVWREYRGHEGRYRGRHFQAEEPGRRGERVIR